MWDTNRDEPLIASSKIDDYFHRCGMEAEAPRAQPCCALPPCVAPRAQPCCTLPQCAACVHPDFPTPPCREAITQICWFYDLYRREYLVRGAHPVLVP